MKKTVPAFLLIFCSIQCIFAQNRGEREDIYLARTGQRILELEMEGAFSLWFTDADTGKPIQDAVVAIENTGSTKTDTDGLAVFPMVGEGGHTFIFQKEGYITTKDTFTVTLGTVFSNKYSIPRIKEIDHIKIVLDWGAVPADLDAHLVKDNEYHISYRNSAVSSDKTAWLDKDAVNGYGPETITVTEIDKGAAYHYFIHNYSNRNAVNNYGLSQSKASIRVYINNRFHTAYEINKGAKGVIWHVFDIINGEIKATGQFE